MFNKALDNDPSDDVFQFLHLKNISVRSDLCGINSDGHCTRETAKETVKLKWLGSLVTESSEFAILKKSIWREKNLPVVEALSNYIVSEHKRCISGRHTLSQLYSDFYTLFAFVIPTSVGYTQCCKNKRNTRKAVIFFCAKWIWNCTSQFFSLIQWNLYVVDIDEKLLNIHYRETQ